MGGAMISASCVTTRAGGDAKPAEKQVSAVKESTPVQEVASKKPTFCKPADPKICVDGKAKAGLECCWGTSC